MPDYDLLPGANTAETTFPPRVLTAAARKNYRTVPVSFETGEQMATKVFFTQSVRIVGWRGQVTKALAATDAGTITLKDSAGNNITPNAVISLAASTVLATEFNQGIPTANTLVTATDFVQLVTAKTTAGGRVLVHLEYEPV